MIILGIETSCDETSVAIIEGDGNNVVLKANIVASSLAIHAQTGGVIPENAAREQIKYILPVLQEALQKADLTLRDIDAIGLTYGPGLIGSLLVGVETAKTIAYVLQKPIVPVNHMVGHIYANFIRHPGEAATSIGSQKIDSIAPARNASHNDAGGSLQNDITFPAIALVISGGHTDLLLLEGHDKLTLLGGTRDDAAGEAFDKIGRLLGLPYPAGPVIEQLAKKGDPKRFRFPRPLIGSTDLDFSFSGLKTAVLNEVMKLKKDVIARAGPKGGRLLDRGGTNDEAIQSTNGRDRHAPTVARDDEKLDAKRLTLDAQTIADISRGTLDAVIDVVTRKTLKAAQHHNAKSILISGGVAANQTLVEELRSKSSELGIACFAPPRNLSTDNAAMVATAAYFNYNPVDWRDVTANPELYFD